MNTAPIHARTATLSRSQASALWLVFRLTAGFAAGFGLTGCGTVHSAHNAPGNIEVAQPPVAIQQRVPPERPADPGENLLIWNAGPFGGVGAVTSSNAAFSASAGGETSLHYGQRKSTHSDDAYLLPFDFPRPDFSVGLNLGVGFGNEQRPANRAGYAELEVSNELFYAIAGGWAWDPERKSSGPQITGSAGPFYLRSTTMLDRATSIEFGIIFKFPVLTFAWSQ